MSKKKVAKPRPRGRPATGQTPQHQFRCPDDEWELFERAAAQKEVSVAVWLRGVATDAAKRALRAQGE